MKNIYTDGSCSKNPGAGAFSIIIFNNNIISYAYREDCEQTTNNREELKAIIKAIEYSKENLEESFIIYTDSSYAERSINDWMYRWYYNDWKNSKNQTVENLDLIKILYNHCNIEFPNFSIEKVKGHNGCIGNELADAAATKNIKKIKEIFSRHDIKYIN